MEDDDIVNVVIIVITTNKSDRRRHKISTNIMIPKQTAVCKIRGREVIFLVDYHTRQPTASIEVVELKNCIKER
jgi:hypothetical protein